MMNTTTKTFRATTAVAMLAVLALPFWQVASKAQADGGGTEPFFVEADQARMDRGITGYLVTPFANGDTQIDVMSEHRAAIVEFDAETIEGEAAITVTVGSSGETLTMMTDTAWAGTASINGSQIASYQHLQDAEWEFLNFNRLQTFTSWGILDDVLSDENLREDLPPMEEVAWIPLLGVIVAALALASGVVFKAIDIEIDQHTSCQAHGNQCYQDGWDPSSPSCVYWETQCADEGAGYCDVCDQMWIDCSADPPDQSACQAYLDFCMGNCL